MHFPLKDGDTRFPVEEIHISQLLREFLVEGVLSHRRNEEDHRPQDRRRSIRFHGT